MRLKTLGRIDMINYDKKAILFGLTKIEYAPARHYLENCKGNVSLIIDNNPDLAGTYNDVPVRPQSALAEYVDDPDVYIVITTFRGYFEITKSLLDMGFRNEKIIVALKDEDFYVSYTAEFYRRKYELTSLAPIRVNIELSRECNCRCIYCPTFGISPAIKSKTGFMSWDVVKAMTKQIGGVPSITKGYFCGKGETFFHPEWFEMIKYIIENSNIKDLIFYSNGMLLNEETVHKLDKLNFKTLWLEISIDGENAEENNQYRRGSNYEKVKQNIEYAVKYFSGKNVTFQILNTHPVTEDYLAENHHVITTFLPTPEFIKNDFPGILNGCRPTIMFGNQESCEGVGVTLRRGRVKQKDIPYPCVNIFNDINFNFLGETLTCSCDLNAHNKPISNVLYDDAIECWKNNDAMRTIRDSFFNGHIPKGCLQCTQAPIKELNVAVRVEEKE